MSEIEPRHNNIDATHARSLPVPLSEIVASGKQIADYLKSVVTEEIDDLRQQLPSWLKEESGQGEDYDRAKKLVIEKLLDNVTFNVRRMPLELNPQGGFNNYEGMVVREEGVYVIQINDEDNMLKKKDFPACSLYDGFMAAVEKIKKSSDLFKAYVVVTGNVVAIGMDPGKHKEFLAGIVPEKGKEAIILYEHLFSPREAENPGSQRSAYIQKALHGKSFSGAKAMRTDKGERNLRAGIVTSEPSRVFFNLARLARSVKDLDLESTLDRKDVDFANKMFAVGVTNMDNFLSFKRNVNDCVLHNADNAESEFINRIYPNSLDTLNAEEREILEAYFYYKTKAKESVAYQKERIGHLQEAKRLNYDVLAGLIELHAQGEETAHGEKILEQKKFQIRRDFERVVALLRKMWAEVCRFNYYYSFIEGANVDIDSLIQKFSVYVDTMDLSAKGEKVLDLEGVFVQYNKMFEDKGGKLEIWSEVNTLAEAVRFLHSLLYRHYEQREKLTKRNNDYLYGDFDNHTGIFVIDAAANGLEKSEIYGAYKKTASTLGSRVLRSLKPDEQKMWANQSPHIVVGDDYAEFSFPAGKHRVEVSVQTKDTDPPEYGLAFNLFESGYSGAERRLEYLRKVLDGLGFRHKKESEGSRGLLVSNYRTENKAEFSRVFSEIVRVVYSLQNLDLNIGSNIDQMKDLFGQGVTDVAIVGRFLLLKLERNALNEDDVGKILKSVYRIGSFKEQEIAARLVVERFKKTESVKQAVSDLDDFQLDRFIERLYDLADTAKAQGNLPQKRKYERLANAIIKVMDERLKAVKDSK